MAKAEKLVAVGALTVFLGLTTTLWPYIVDDAFISLRYAQNLVEGHGLVYNPGERVEGVTNLLWTVLLVLTHLLPGDAVISTKLLSLACAGAAAWATADLARASGLVPPDRAWWPAALWLSLPLVAVSAAEGLETMAFTALLVGTLATALRGAGPSTGLGLALLTLTRPDGALVLPPVLAYLAWRYGRPPAARALVVALVPLVAVEVWRLGYYDEWLPNTFYAKSGGGWWLFVASLRSFIGFCAVAGAGAWLLAAPAFRQPAAWLLISAALTRVGFHLWSGGPWMGEHRFLIPMIPMAAVLVAAGTLTITRRSIGIAVASLLFLLPGWLLFAGGVPAYRAYGHGVSAAYRPLGEHLRAILPADGVYACGDAGAIAYYARRTAIDILGLNDRHIARRPGQFSLSKHDADYVLSRQPDAIVLTARSASGGDWITPPDAAIANHQAFRAQYRRSASWAFLQGYHLILYLRLPASQLPNPSSR